MSDIEFHIVSIAPACHPEVATLSHQLANPNQN